MAKRNKKNKKGKQRLTVVTTSTEVEQIQTPKDFELYISQDVYNKVMHWVNKSNNEVSGFGNIEYDPEENRFTVVDVFLLQQENTGTTTEIDASSMGRLMWQQREFGEGALKWWWHSHVNMGVFWSGTDKETIENYGKNGYIVATVFNKRHEMRTAVCYKTSHALFGDSHVLIDEVDTSVTYPIEWDEEYDANVRERTYQNYSSGYNNYNRSYLNSASNPSNQQIQSTVELNRTTEPENKTVKIIDTATFTGDKSNFCEGKEWLKGVGWVWKKELEEATRPDNTSRETSKPQSFNDDGSSRGNIYVNGLLGDYGLAAEAGAVKMTVDAYERKLAMGTEAELDEIQNRLTQLEQAGYFENLALAVMNGGTIEDGGESQGV